MATIPPAKGNAHYGPKYKNNINHTLKHKSILRYELTVNYTDS